MVYNNNITYSCGVGKITVNVTQGEPATYELWLSSDNSVVKPAQTSNILEDVDPGDYKVVVKDTCGNQKVLGVTVEEEQNNYQFVRATTNNLGFNQLYDCDHYNHNIYVFRNGTGNGIPAEKFPIQITYKVTGPGGTPETTLNYTMNSVSDNGMEVTDIPFYYNQAFTIEASLEDACGNTYTQTDDIAARKIDMDLLKPAGSCGTTFFRVRTYLTGQPYTISFESYPDGFQPWDYSSNFADGSFVGNFTELPLADIGSPDNGLPSGNYTVKLTDACGNTITKSTRIDADYILKNLYQREGCDAEGGVYLRLAASNNLQQVGDITSLSIISGPDTYSTTYPVVIDNAILDNGDAIVGALPAGTYEIEAENTCGAKRKVEVTLDGAEYNIDKTITYNCGSFNITAALTSNLNNPYIYLEHYNPDNSTWERVGLIPRPGNTPNYTGTLSNVSEKGEFRLHMPYSNYLMGERSTCDVYTETFQVEDLELSLNDYYTISCADNRYDLVIDAEGVAPLTYKIIEKDGAAFTLDNEEDPVFTDLEEGSYKVEVKDSCGNIIRFNTRIVANKLPRVQHSTLCTGENGYLYVDGLSYLEVQWYKDGVALDGETGHKLNFASYDSNTHRGEYKAVLTYNPNPNACAINTIPFSLTPDNENNASAGTGGTNTLNYNDVNGPVDLFTYLTGHDTNGTWSETTNSGLLIENEWHADLANGGTYTFEYTVEGTCSGTDTATVTIEYSKQCYKNPLTDAGITVPSQIGISSLERPIANEDNWPMVRQSGYLVLESKTKGFVVNRLNPNQMQSIVDAGHAVEGMMVYDTGKNCLSIYTDANGWKCFSTPACPSE